MTSKRDTARRPDLPGSGHMENYTLPFLVSAGVLCFVGLVVLWAVAGLPVVILCTVLADRILRR